MMKMVENVNVGPWRLKSPLLDLDRNDKIRPKQTFHKTLWIPDCGNFRLYRYCGSLDFIQIADSSSIKTFMDWDRETIVAIAATSCVCFLYLEMRPHCDGTALLVKVQQKHQKVKRPRAEMMLFQF